MSAILAFLSTLIKIFEGFPFVAQFVIPWLIQLLNDFLFKRIRMILCYCMYAGKDPCDGPPIDPNHDLLERNPELINDHRRYMKYEDRYPVRKEINDLIRLDTTSDQLIRPVDVMNFQNLITGRITSWEMAITALGWSNKTKQLQILLTIYRASFFFVKIVLNLFTTYWQWFQENNGTTLERILIVLLVWLPELLSSFLMLKNIITHPERVLIYLQAGWKIPKQSEPYIPFHRRFSSILSFLLSPQWYLFYCEKQINRLHIVLFTLQQTALYVGCWLLCYDVIRGMFAIQTMSGSAISDALWIHFTIFSVGLPVLTSIWIAGRVRFQSTNNSLVNFVEFLRRLTPLLTALSISFFVYYQLKFPGLSKVNLFAPNCCDHPIVIVLFHFQILFFLAVVLVVFSSFVLLLNFAYERFGIWIAILIGYIFFCMVCIAWSVFIVRISPFGSPCASQVQFFKQFTPTFIITPAMFEFFSTFATRSWEATKGLNMYLSKFDIKDNFERKYDYEIPEGLQIIWGTTLCFPVFYVYLIIPIALIPIYTMFLNIGYYDFDLTPYVSIFPVDTFIFPFAVTIFVIYIISLIFLKFFIFMLFLFYYFFCFLCIIFLHCLVGISITISIERVREISTDLLLGSSGHKVYRERYMMSEEET